MDIRKIKKLIELVEESGIDELEITEGEESVRIARNRAPSAVSYSMPAPVAAPAAVVQRPNWSSSGVATRTPSGVGGSSRMISIRSSVSGRP